MHCRVLCPRRSPVERDVSSPDVLRPIRGAGWIGRSFGDVPLAAVGVNVSVFGLAFLVFNFLAYGTTPMVARAANGIFRGWQDTRTPFLVVLGLNAVNLVLDPILIFGMGWGLAGAAIATAVAQWTGAVAFLWLILGTRRDAFGVRPVLPRPRDLLPFLRVGGALVMRTFSLVGTLTLATAMATRIGTVAVAAHLVASQLWLMLALLIDAIAVAGQAIVGRLRGEARPGDVARAADRLLAWGFGVGTLLALGFLALEPWLPRLFTDDAAAMEATRTVLPFVIAMQPLNALVFVWDGIYMGAEEFRFVAAQMVTSAVAAYAVLLLVVPMGWGLQGVWWGFVALMFVRAATLGFRYGRVFRAA